MSKTIKQIADELGVSKTAIRKRLTADFRAKYTTNANGVIIINDDGCKIIAETVQTFAETAANTANQFAETSETPIVDLLKGTISTLNMQLAEKDKLIAELTEQNKALTVALEHTTASLSAAHALQAADKQQLLDLTANGNKVSHWWQLIRIKKQ